MKPSWNNAPEWANYLAMNRDGEWYWHMNAPYKIGYCFISFHRHSFAGSGHGKKWEDTIETRPAEV